MIKIENLNVSIANKEIISGLNISIMPSTITLISGRNGVGKSTLLRVVAGVNKEYSGFVYVFNKDIRDYRCSDKKNIVSSYLGKNYFDNLSVFDNLKLSTFYMSNNRKSIDDVVNYFELESLLNLYPVNLSNGQQQKLSLAIAFLNNCKLFLLDEPFNFLDNNSIEKLLKTLIYLKEEHDVTILISSHISYRHEDFFDNVILIKDSDDVVMFDYKIMSDLYCFDVEKSSFEFFEDKKMIGFWGKKKIYQSEYKLFLSSNCEHFNCVLKYSLNYKKISIDEFLTYETN